MGRHLETDAETALHRTTEKFLTRFAGVEKKLKTQGKTLVDSKSSLKEAKEKLGPLEDQCSLAVDSWKEARAAEREIAEQWKLVALESRILEKWNEKLDTLKGSVELIFPLENIEMAEQIEKLVASVPEGERRAMIEQSVRDTLAERKGELDRWVKSLRSLSGGAKEVFGVDGLIDEWEEYQLHGSEEARRELVESFETRWASLDELVKDGLPAEKVDFASLLEERSARAFDAAQPAFHFLRKFDQCCRIITVEND